MDESTPLDRSAPAPLLAALIPVLRGWKVLLAALLVSWVATIGTVLALGRSYAAVALLTPVSSSRTLSATGGLAASLLGAQAMGGVQATPAFVVRLARMGGVLSAVATSKISPTSSERIGDRLLRVAPGTGSPDKMIRKMRGVISASYDAPTGIVTLQVVERDSALARLILGRIIDQVSESFIRASRAQATEIRRSQDLRVDSAAKQLRRAEEQLLAFNSNNRVVSAFSSASVDRQRFQRAVDVAQTVYMQAVNDREAAVAKELEETPAVVTLDPPPAVLPPEPRGLVAKLVFVSILVLSFGALLLIARSRARSAIARASAEDAELAETLAGVPGLARAGLVSKPGGMAYPASKEAVEPTRARARQK